MDNLIPEQNADRVNALISDPSIAEWVFGDYEVNRDMSILVNNKENFFFVFDLGGAGLVKISHGIYEFHSFVLPDGRGRWAMDKFKQIRDWLFLYTSALSIITHCPVNNQMAIGAARMCRFKKYDTVKDGWSQGGQKYDLDAYILCKGDV